MSSQDSSKKPSQEPLENKINPPFSGGLNCSQSIIARYAGRYNIDESIACKLATGLGGGMGRMGNTCGALTGAYLVLGLEFGSDSLENKNNKEHTYQKIQNFTDKFKQQHGACNCRDLLGCDISSESGFKEAREKGLTKTRCPVFVQDAMDLLAEMLPEKKSSAE